ncbi:AABR07073021.1 [Phodopus roborovskii]|uniref:AABR07073021.1 protein n=1 Tax=Phodopus roborovskii TaxID=109678 RepID=A0AAV0A167_PHORO|nr:AABR07073021.1 [Phodopus roborovskii]
MQLRRTLGWFRGADIRGAFSWVCCTFGGPTRLLAAHQSCEGSGGRPKVDLSPPGSGKDRTRDKTTPEGQVRVPFLEEAAEGKAMTLALNIARGPSLENTLQRLFPLIVNPEPYSG